MYKYKCKNKYTFKGKTEGSHLEIYYVKYKQEIFLIRPNLFKEIKMS